MIEAIQRLWAHARWADLRLLAGLHEAEARGGAPVEAWREYAHILGTTETWLARLTQRVSGLAVWPALDPAEALRLTELVHAGYAAYLKDLTVLRMTSQVRYTSSAGQSFENSVGDILLHAAMHAQYHRGKVNLLLRQAGRAPAPTDYIAFVRGVPAATTPPPR
ncbi:MAG: DinB family protein [Gemmatimonadales bacterium]